MKKAPKQKSKLGWLIDHYLADIRHFFRHGIKQRFRFLRGFSGDMGKDAKDWWKTREARRKFAKNERRYQASKLREDAKFGFKGFLGSLGSLLTAPFRLPKWAWFKFQELRRLSFRDACAEVWMGYRGLVAGGLNRAEYHFKRMMQFPLWLRGICILLLIGVVAGLAASPFLLDAARQYRSESMLADARRLESESQLVKAYQKARTAALLQPNNEEARDYILELSEEIRTPEALWWAERVARDKDYDADSLAKVIKLATYYGKPKIGLQYLGMLKDDYPEHPAITDAELRILMAQGRRVDAMALAQQAYREGHDSEVVHQLLAEQYLAASDPVARSAAAEYLKKHLQRDDEVGLMLMQMVLAYYDRLGDETQEQLDLQQLCERVRNNPEAESELRVLALGRAHQAGAISADEALAGLLEEFDPRDPDERQELLSYAQNFGLYDVIEHMPKSARKEYADLELEGLLLGETPDLEAARTMLDEAKQVGVSPSSEAFARALLAEREGKSEAFSEQLIRALDAADPEAWVQLERQAHLALERPQLLEFYRESLRAFPGNSLVVSRGLSYAYTEGADAEIALWANELPMSTFRRDPYNQMFLIYLKALHDRDLPTIRYYAEQLVAKYPRESYYYMVLAFVYAQSGKPELAEAVMQPMNVAVNYESLPPFLRVCLARAGYPGAIRGLEPKLKLESEAVAAPKTAGAS